ncbi:hypothetical protein BAE44_0004023 [Dichanthelium oligosanthes]|uniref:DUF4220 domain-containing protein n=1 Tax=Dichanthelium oligosanthes TaxID=888268 RepID=A0A1E5WC37_9POAL|nr:hypothetical protein BAE44_0004023 [Dichanthelium oligosanthes]
MARAGPLDLWNEWATQILVLLSLTLQVVLLFAGIRRRKASAVPRFLLWLAYLMADSTAIYAVGHLAISSAPREHQVVAFWAPFLLLHLGGPDSITAYALEDNQLWKRHFLTLVVQVLGAGYVLYKHVAGNGMLVTLAAVLMSAVGVVKYAERTWALRRANFSSIRRSLRDVPSNKHQHRYLQDHDGYCLRWDEDTEDESLLQRAHSLFNICKRGIVDSVIEMDSDTPDTETIHMIKELKKDSRSMWTVMEMELSLMYDILYTKADVIHTWTGYSIRAFSAPAIFASFLLFQFSGKDGNSRVDVVITYILLGGALTLEMASLLSALGSSWALAFLRTTRWSWLRHAVLCSGRWHRFRRAVLSLSRFARTMMGSSSHDCRRWADTMEQYNILHFCTAQVDSTTHLIDRMAKMLEFREWWERKHSWAKVVIPDVVRDRTKAMVSIEDLNTMGLLRKNWVEVGLGIDKHKDFLGKLGTFKGVDFHESILIWHIATDLFLTSSKQAKEDEARPIVEAIIAVSNYMMFLMAKRPYMLPGLPQNWLYERTCENLVQIWDEHHRESGSFSVFTQFTVLSKLFRYPDDPRYSRLEQRKELAGIILHKYEDKKSTFDARVPRLTYACQIASLLIKKEQEDETYSVGVLVDLWMGFLLYAANRCNRASHAKKLNSGGEFTTVVWLMIEHLYQISFSRKQGP